MLDLLRKDGIGEVLDTRITKTFDTDAAAEGLSHRLVTFRSFMMLIATFISLEANTAMDENKYSVLYPSKELMNTIKTVDDDSKSPLRTSDSGSEKIPCKKSFKRLS